MKKFWVDYQASMEIEAETAEEAEALVYQVYNDNTRRYLQVDSVEEMEENEDEGDDITACMMDSLNSTGQW